MEGGGGGDPLVERNHMGPGLVPREKRQKARKKRVLFGGRKRTQGVKETILQRHHRNGQKGKFLKIESKGVKERKWSKERTICKEDTQAEAGPLQCATIPCKRGGGLSLYVYKIRNHDTDSNEKKGEKIRNDEKKGSSEIKITKQYNEPKSEDSHILEEEDYDKKGESVNNEGEDRLQGGGGGIAYGKKEENKHRT